MTFSGSLILQGYYNHLIKFNDQPLTAIGGQLCV